MPPSPSPTQSILEKSETKTIVGKSIWRCYKARDIVDLCVKEIVKDPQLTHCGNTDCERCNDAVLGGPIIEFEF